MQTTPFSEDFLQPCTCGSTSFIENSEGCTVCTECGVVQTLVSIDCGNPYRSFEDDEHDRSHFGLPNDSSLSTVVGNVSGSSSPPPLQKKLQNLSKPFIQKNVSNKLLSRLCSDLDLGKNCEILSQELFSELVSFRVTRSHEHLIFAILYIVAKDQNMSRTPRELLAYATKTNHKQFSRALKSVQKYLFHKTNNHPLLNRNSSMDQKLDFARRSCNRLGMMGKEAEQVVKKCRELCTQFPSKTARTISAVAILLVTKDRFKLDEVTEACGVSEVSVERLLRNLGK